MWGSDRRSTARLRPNGCGSMAREYVGRGRVKGGPLAEDLFSLRLAPELVHRDRQERRREGRAEDREGTPRRRDGTRREGGGDEKREGIQESRAPGPRGAAREGRRDSTRESDHRSEADDGGAEEKVAGRAPLRRDDASEPCAEEREKERPHGTEEGKGRPGERLVVRGG